MHVGVFMNRIPMHYGGAFTFQGAVIEALTQTKTNHRVTLFGYDQEDNRFNRGLVRFVKLIPPTGKVNGWRTKGKEVYKNIKTQIFSKEIPLFRRGALHQASWAERIDLMWFPTQAYEYVEVPYVYTVWDLQHRLQPYFPEVSVTGADFAMREREFSFVCPRAAYVTVPNDAASEELHLFYGIPKSRIILMPQPISDFALHPNTDGADLKVVPETPFLFYPAQFWPHKNHVVILEALRLLKERWGVEYRAVFTGADKGNEKYVREYTVRLGLKDQVSFLGFVSPATLTLLYQKAFALTFVSYFGPENMPPMEAFALGCPVIASQVSGAEFQLASTCLMFDPRSEEELAQAIMRIREDPKLRNDLIAKGKERVTGHAGENYVKRFYNIADKFAPIRRCWSSEERYIHT